MIKDNKTTHLVTLTLGKCRYGKRRENLTTITVGFRYIDGNPESYFTVTGDIWNRTRTDILTGGACVDTEIVRYFHGPLVRHIAELCRKWHLTNFSKIPGAARAEIFATMEEMERRETERKAKAEAEKAARAARAAKKAVA